jgi:hypothetical protein
MKPIWIHRLASGAITWSKKSPPEKQLIGMVTIDPAKGAVFHQAPDAPMTVMEMTIVAAFLDQTDRRPPRRAYNASK